ncbi:MAG: rhomboid family intramembrane serine protease [Gemmatimonadetes bacterium]|nr:rhomboid family intramembrane serine protease [Gemmatimonadota bacterium]
MFPYKDENPTELVPYLTFLLIAANIAVWLFMEGAGTSPAIEAAVCTYGAIPAELTGLAPRGPRLCPFGGAAWSSLFTSMFLHGSWWHLIGNMMFLWVFGNNVEDSMGHLRFALFFVLTGLVAALAHVALNPASRVPVVGASGAISGVMGAYMILYPRALVYVLMPPFFVVRLPAYIVLGYWIVLQVFFATLDLAGADGGVAFWAHVGGFFSGLALVKPFARRELVSAKRMKRRIPRAEIREHRWWW